MITLYGFGPFLGTPDSSPFVIKVMLLLKLAALSHRIARGNPFKAPHRLLPYIEEDGARVADSTLIRVHLEQRHGVDFDAGLGAEQRAIAWAAEKMCEDHLYFALLDMRWSDRATFERGLGRHMFGAIPAPLRPPVKALMRRMNAKRLHGHGLGRLSPAERTALAARDIEALAALLGGKPYLMGERPCAADASVFAIVTAILTPPLETPLRAAVARHANLAAYRDRLTARWFAEPASARAASSEGAAALQPALGR
jgi:glutathione S-transferase